MGKHETKEQAFSWDPPADDYYKARIKELERANAELEAKVRHLEADAQIAELAEEQGEYIKAGIIGDLEAEIESLRTENGKL